MNGAVNPLYERIEPKVMSTDDRGRAYFGSQYANRDIQVLMSEELTDLDEIPVYHGVHDTGVITDEMRAKLWAKYFGMHWFDEPYTGRWKFEELQKEYDEDPDKKNRRPLTDWKNCNALATRGGILTLRDTRFEPDGTKLMRISLVLPQTMTPIPFGDDDEAKYLKTLEVHPPATFVVTDDEYPKLFDNIAPRLGTIKQWDKHEDVPRRVFRELLRAR
ncbi:hypothetical protein [Haloarchaeobius litoreus]|uniref:Uncharacterized protein n=1 Tax=Haloarchaeobius litoreus TaxID=755306 RepID=A0ABD6DNW2_9EURY|nr:hypothetical protein [Haloarchaeobius litoreus]